MAKPGRRSRFKMACRVVGWGMCSIRAWLWCILTIKCSKCIQADSSEIFSSIRQWLYCLLFYSQFFPVVFADEKKPAGSIKNGTVSTTVGSWLHDSSADNSSTF